MPMADRGRKGKGLRTMPMADRESADLVVNKRVIPALMYRQGGKGGAA
ncbi:MAG: hypothetical protein HY884_00620 [Deltaproteobacteria bacterium]|nr:hypothetical protein [Deltaproteobacteria bacterium]